MLLNFEYEELFFENDGIRLHAIAAGPKLGPVVVLLHGFPEFWYGWRKQIGPLAAAGFRVIALDQRGYNLSSKPAAVSDYAAVLLTRDVVSVADQLGCERFYLAGHDWGAAVAWAMALQYPQRLHKLAIINVPHPAVMMHTLRTNPRQWLLQLVHPVLPTAMAARDCIVFIALLLGRALAAADQPSWRIYCRRSRRVQNFMVSARNAQRDHQLVSRPHSPSTQNR